MTFFNKKTQKKSSKKAEEQQVEPVESNPKPESSNIIMFPSLGNESASRSIGLIGDVNEEKASEVVYALLALWKSYEPPPENPKQKPDPIEIYISTHGGSASDMFAIYDVMRMVKKDSDISTVGLGKVMSAGVLLLAAGTKGKRKIGKNCRVMIHSVLGGSEGPIHSLENEMNEIRWTQDRYIKALIDETKLTQATMNKLLQKHVNIYLSAEEAVKYGIADEVI